MKKSTSHGRQSHEMRLAVSAGKRMQNKPTLRHTFLKGTGGNERAVRARPPRTRRRLRERKRGKKWNSSKSKVSGGREEVIKGQILEPGSEGGGRKSNSWSIPLWRIVGPFIGRF